MLVRSREVLYYKISLFISSRQRCLAFCHDKNFSCHSWEEVDLSDLQDFSSIVAVIFQTKTLEKPLVFLMNKIVASCFCCNI